MSERDIERIEHIALLGYGEELAQEILENLEEDDIAVIIYPDDDSVHLVRDHNKSSTDNAESLNLLPKSETSLATDNPIIPPRKRLRKRDEPYIGEPRDLGNHWFGDWR